MSYAIFLDKDNETLRLPVNPTEVQIGKSQSNDNYNVLKLGQVVKPKNAELDKYSFEAELPSKPYSYVETKGDFKTADFYLTKFEEWRNSNAPLRLVISNESTEISTLVIFESLDIIEKAGEEGDYYINFKFTQYKSFGKKEVEISQKPNGKLKAKVNKPKRSGQALKPKSHLVVNGDTLWGISKKYLGDGSKYTQLLKVNPKIKNPSLLKVGQVIKLA